MNGSANPDYEGEDSDRVIDRSGDIDQRPIEEKSGISLANDISFRPPIPFESHAFTLPATIATPRILTIKQAPTRVGTLTDIAHRHQKDIDKQFAKAKSQLESLSQKIEAQEKRCITPKLDDDLQQIRFQRQKILIANGPLLADHLSAERGNLADLERFAAQNRIARGAHYPESSTLGFGILLVLILVEAGINGVLFAESSDEGLFGGWLEAIVLSVTNVGAAFLVGRLLLPQLNRPGFAIRACAITAAAAGLTLLVAINLFGAHFRDFKAELAKAEPAQALALPKKEPGLVLSGSKGIAHNAPQHTTAKPKTVDLASPQISQGNDKRRSSEKEAIQKIFEAPLDLQSFTSFFLLVIGLCGAVIAACDGYRFDDPFPGYGKRHRRYTEARAKSSATVRRILNQSNAVMAGTFQAIAQKIENHAQQMSTLLTLHQEYAGEFKLLKDALDEAARNADAEIASHDRLQNKAIDRISLELHAVALKQLPELNERHLKVYENQDRKLKALQKMAQKEQSDALSVFDTASADFQRLLAEASHSSLQSALVQPPLRGESGTAQ